jgi:hypothetical protein
MVLGAVLIVTPVPGTYQCADTASTAFGRGMDLPIDAHPSVYLFVAKAFIGLPCPKKIAGIRLLKVILPFNDLVFLRDCDI